VTAAAIPVEVVGGVDVDRFVAIFARWNTPQPFAAVGGDWLIAPARLVGMGWLRVDGLPYPAIDHAALLAAGWPYRVTVREPPSVRRTRFRRLDWKAVDTLLSDCRNACPPRQIGVALLPGHTSQATAVLKWSLLDTGVSLVFRKRYVYD
jgi:hypothetical protein